MLYSNSSSIFRILLLELFFLTVICSIPTTQINAEMTTLIFIAQTPQLVDEKNRGSRGRCRRPVGSRALERTGGDTCELLEIRTHTA